VTKKRTNNLYKKKKIRRGGGGGGGKPNFYPSNIEGEKKKGRESMKRKNGFEVLSRATGKKPYVGDPTKNTARRGGGVFKTDYERQQMTEKKPRSFRGQHGGGTFLTRKALKGGGKKIQERTTARGGGVDSKQSRRGGKHPDGYRGRSEKPSFRDRKKKRDDTT